LGAAGIAEHRQNLPPDRGNVCGSARLKRWVGGGHKGEKLYILNMFQQNNVSTPVSTSGGNGAGCSGPPLQRPEKAAI
jgi:hypothetical protein